MADLYNFSIDEGVDTVVDISSLPDGEEFDLTNYTASLYVKRVSSAPKIFELSSPSDGITIDIPTSKLFLLFSAEKTLGFFGSYSYDLIITNSSTSVVKKIVSGVVTINHLITK